MNRYVVVTALGTDRVGIVDDLTEQLLERDCNVEESRMALLGGEFALLMMVSGSEAAIDSLESNLSALQSAVGLSMHVKRTEPAPPAAQARAYEIESVSLDHPGIVHSITSILRAHGVNIEDLETDTQSAPWTGSPMFVMSARVVVPAGVSVSTLREELERLAESNDLDITVRAVV